MKEWSGAGSGTCRLKNVASIREFGLDSREIVPNDTLVVRPSRIYWFYALRKDM
jgi:hypothetical protein